jgi:hypothetical protein
MAGITRNFQSTNGTQVQISAERFFRPTSDDIAAKNVNIEVSGEHLRHAQSVDVFFTNVEHRMQARKVSWEVRGYTASTVEVDEKPYFERPATQKLSLERRGSQTFGTTLNAVPVDYTPYFNHRVSANYVSDYSQKVSVAVNGHDFLVPPGKEHATYKDFEFDFNQVSKNP